MKIVIKLNKQELNQAIRDYVNKLDLPPRATYSPDDIYFTDSTGIIGETRDMNCVVTWVERLK